MDFLDLCAVYACFTVVEEKEAQLLYGMSRRMCLSIQLASAFMVFNKTARRLGRLAVHVPDCEMATNP